MIPILQWFTDMRTYSEADHPDGPATPPTEAAIARTLFVVLDAVRLGITVEVVNADVMGGTSVDVIAGHRRAWLSVFNSGTETTVFVQHDKTRGSAAGIDLPRIKAWLDGGEL